MVCFGILVFGLKTNCPFCGDAMIFSDCLEDPEEPAESDSDLEDAPGVRFLGVVDESQTT